MSESAEREGIGRWAWPAVPAASFVALLVWTWGKWPEAFIDFGRELYVPWCLSEGQRLYEDVAYLNGPLSPWTNAVLFRVFGVGLRTLTTANIVITALVAAIVWRLVRLVGGRAAAATATVVFLVVFGFGQFMPGGAYNFIAPYFHEMTHGTLLAGAALLLMARHVLDGSRWSVLACGVCLGLVFLTKPEFVVASWVATAVGLGLHHVLRGTPRREVVGLAGLFASGVVLPPVAALLLLLPGRSVAEALKGLAGTWVHVFNEQVTDSKFYRDLRGTSDIGGSLATIAVWTAGYAAALGPPVLAAFTRGRSRLASLALHALLPFAAAAVVLAGWRWGAWENCTRPLPLLLVAALVPAALAVARTRNVLAFSFLLYAVLLPLKVWLNLRTIHYGFALALPAAVAFVVILLEWVTPWIERRGGSSGAFRAAVFGAVAAVAFVQLQATHYWLERKTVRLGSGPDVFLADERETRVAALVERFAKLRAPGETVVMLPEGAMIPYLTRTPGPMRYFAFTPPDLAIYGEDRLVAALDAHPPDWIVVVHRPLREYGYRVLGDDYALGITAWVAEHYAPVDRILASNARGREEEYALILRRGR